MNLPIGLGGIIFIALQLGASIWGFSKAILGGRGRVASLRLGVAAAKTGASLINLNSCILILTMCQALLTKLSTKKLFKILSFDHQLSLHRNSAIMLLIGAMIHCSAHIMNLVNLSKFSKVNFGHSTLITGYLLILAFMIIAITSFLRRRFKVYEIFSYTHYILTLPSIGLIIAHGMFCFLRDHKGNCSGSLTIYWLSIPIMLYIIDQAWRWIRSCRFSYICKVIGHPSRVFEIQIRKPNFTFIPGQYLLLMIPSVSIFQWHPFTITSASEEDHISIHIREVGNWTKLLKETLQARSLEDIRVFVDGPFGSSSQYHKNYPTIVCIGAGVGQTPFASIVKSLWYQINRPIEPLRLEKLYYIGIGRELRSFQWFNDILKALENSDNKGVLDVRLYVTGKVDLEDQVLIAAHHELRLPDPITGLKTETQYGRPKLEELFMELSNKHLGKVGVFYCGPKILGDTISSLCQKNTDSLVKFDFYSEMF